MLSSFSSSSPNAITNEPTRKSGTFRLSHTSSNISLPRTLSFAISVPGTQSYPAWTMALLARLAPIATSSHASLSAIFSPVCDSSRAIAQPVTPAPIISTSY